MHLYNKYRPQTLRDIKGQEETTEILRGLFKSGQLPHSMLFVGVRGTGKTTAARIFAKYANCEHPDEYGPCLSCDACHEIEHDGNADIREFDAASNSGVEDMRALVESANYAPMHKKKVFIIDECHALSPSAWQAILKLLEEPPKDVIFILCTTEVHKVPATIISRCRTFYFKTIPENVIVQQLMYVCEKESFSYESEALLLIAKAACGSMRDSLSILEQFTNDNISVKRVRDVLGLTPEESIFGLIKSIIDGSCDMALDILKEISHTGRDTKMFLKELIQTLTDIVYFIQSGTLDEIQNTESYKESVADIGYMLTPVKCFELIETFTDAYSKTGTSVDADFILQTALVKAITKESVISTLEKRICYLESTVANGIPEHSEKTENSETEPCPIQKEQKEDLQTSMDHESTCSDPDCPDENECCPIIPDIPSISDIPMDSQTDDQPAMNMVGNMEVVGTISVFDSDEDITENSFGECTASTEESAPQEDADKNNDYDFFGDIFSDYARQ